MAGPGPWPPGAGGSRWAEEALGIAAARRRPALAAFSAFSFIPPRREGPPELSYFNRAAKTEHVFTYDTIFRIPEGYNQHLPRCDRKHAKGHGLNINEECTLYGRKGSGRRTSLCSAWRFRRKH
ncbi:uncharacterized protein C5orf49 homolog isoform X3 [Pipra filicauda]|uniref:Uncharacterized protein C5orf49 homolog isoform X3 n=1 Tax=Pipra filicauda TaxID=649802 RepID=A0A7R5KNE5_9PASS|nr:uncharacterized protein C5orf49 homolog isoform X3 [Pipra filicauda]